MNEGQILKRNCGHLLKISDNEDNISEKGTETPVETNL